MGLETVNPNGAFYTFPSLEKYGLDSFSFATKLLKEGGISAVPGSAFTKYAEGYLRISYACEMSAIVEGMNRLEAFLQNFE